jgi:hypothetical protein
LITVSIGGKEIVVKPKKLLDYVEKLDFIKSRRTRPWDLISGFPKEMTEENYKILVATAMRVVYTNSSSVTPEEELLFDKSTEGFFYDLWRQMGKGMRKVGTKQEMRPETPLEGITRAQQIWDSATVEEKNNLKIALFATDEANNLGNSAGPSDQSPTPGPTKQSRSGSKAKVP